MGYLHISNLYKDTTILLFKECYALEKIHGTSAHISWKHDENKISFFSGGEKHERFITLFDEEQLKTKFKELFDMDVTIFGEAYGGRLQGMRETYGDNLKFIVFDVKVEYFWVDVPGAEDIANKMGLEFVPYVKCITDLEELNCQRDYRSIVAERNGIKEMKIREGIVVRPLIELTKNSGDRIIAKHKRDEFRETKTKREVNPESLKILEDANKIAEEWVTPMRLSHILDKLGNPTEIEKIPIVIKAMFEDIKREGEGEIVMTKAVGTSIGRITANLYKNKISKIKGGKQ